MSIKDTLINSTSISASCLCAQDIMTMSSEPAENAAIRGMADMKRPSGGFERRSGCVIPHYAGPAALLRHSLPAHLSKPLNFAELIRVSLKMSSSEFRSSLQENQVRIEKESRERHSSLIDRVSALETELKHRPTEAQLERAKTWGIVTAIMGIVAILSKNYSEM